MAIPGLTLPLLQRAMDLADKAYGGAKAFSGEKLIRAYEPPGMFHPHYFIIEDNDYLWIINRGTCSGDDWKTNFVFNESARKFGDEMIVVHEGFYFSAKNVFADMKETILKYGNKRILMTGHSMGGAVTTMLHTMILTDPTTKFLDLYSIAFAPAPALEYVPQYANDRLISIVDHDDIIPTFCVPALYNVVKPIIPKWGIPKVFLKIIIKISLTALKENGVPFGEDLYVACMGAIDTIIDRLSDYIKDQTCLKIKYLGGTIYRLKAGNVFSQSIVPKTETLKQRGDLKWQNKVLLK